MILRKRRKLNDGSEEQRMGTSSMCAINSLRNGKSPTNGRKSSDVNRWVKRLTQALRQSLACQRWEDASKILYALTHEPDRTSEVIWKAGFQILCNHQNSTVTSVKQFARSMLLFEKVFPAEITLQSVLYFMEKGDLASAKEILEAPVKKLYNQLNEKQKYISQILEGYKILVNFAILKQNSEGVEDDFSCHQRNCNLAEFEMKILAEEAVQKISSLINEPGCWDIFVIILVQLLKYNNMMSSIPGLLELYIESKPLHPNAYIFLYDFLKIHHPENTQKLTDLLKKISQISPSDPRILDMISLGLFDKCTQLEAMFNFLDYFCWKDDPKPWDCLVNVVISMYQNPSHIEFTLLWNLWNDRNSWWKSYHFSLTNIQTHSRSSAEVAVSKAVVMLIFNNSNDPFIKEVKTKIKASKFKGLLKQLKDFKELKRSVKLPSRFK